MSPGDRPVIDIGSRPITTKTRPRNVVAATLTASCLLVGAAACAPATAGQPRYGPARLQRDLDAVHAAGATGVLAEVRRDGHRLRGTSGVADLTTGAPVNPAGHFRMGSVTKAFVAVVVLQLVGGGRLGLDDPVDRWLPGVVAGKGNDGRAITVRHLLQHRSGLQDYTDDLAAGLVPGPEGEAYYRDLRFRTFVPAELVALALAREPRFPSGKGWHYANTNYVLAGMVIERVTGHHWSDEVRKRILRPLGLRNTAAPGESTSLPEPHATGYLYFEPGRPLDATEQNMTWTDAAGALTTTADDLGRFWSAVARGRLLPPALQAEMQQAVPAEGWEEETPGVRYGLGVAWRPLSCGGGYWGHGGDVPGFTTASGVSEDGRATAVVSLSTLAADGMHPAAWALVDHALCDQP